MGYKVYTITTLALLLFSVSLFSQDEKKISRDWTSFTQSITVKTKVKTKFKLQASVKVDRGTKGDGMAGLWARVDNTNGESGFFDNMLDRPITTNQWETYVIEGEIDANADTINFGGICLYNGKFYFDDFELFLQNKDGVYEKIELDNARFENKVTDKGIIPGWRRGIGKNKVTFIKEFTARTSKNTINNTYCLVFEGKGVKNNSVIRSEEGFSPQIGTLVSMLNNLSKRVESAVHNLDTRETDHLLDEKANRIGALVMHLAAAEAYYQVYTFENRGFTKEEKEKWDIALDLGVEAREKFKGKPISYYLDVYKEVRKKTIALLAKQNDNWLEQMRPGSSMNNHFAWFHVMEHQSSHLGQILLLKKRIPEEKNEIKLPKEKVEQ